MIKAANGIFSLAAADRKRSPNQRFDLGADDDQSLGFPTSIKSSKTNIIYLSDARHYWESFDFAPYRMLVGRYRQEGRAKVFYAIHEFILRERYRVDLLGMVTADEIGDFHNRLRSFDSGPVEKARASRWAQTRKSELRPRLGLVVLNPKIDSKNQRRLQCSVGLDRLTNIVDYRDRTVHEMEFGNLMLPLRIVSGPRKFRED